ncbi:MAG: PEP-CTERM sorting domain-containing protein [Acidobacteriaceae bacterium]|nr:PEP-CTERM sorting domain-containing protein [Acidobacteriaceae bacterium]
MTVVSGPGISTASAFGSAAVDLTTTYDFTPVGTAAVPEPATVVLFTAGLLGAGLLRRRASPPTGYRSH